MYFSGLVKKKKIETAEELQYMLKQYWMFI